MAKICFFLLNVASIKLFFDKACSQVKLERSDASILGIFTFNKCTEV